MNLQNLLFKIYDLKMITYNIVRYEKSRFCKHYNFFGKYIDCSKLLPFYPVRYISAYRFITRNCIFAKKKVEVENLQSKINSQWHINYVDVLITSSFLLNMLHGVSHNNLWVSVQIFHLKIKIVLYCLYKSYICAIHFKYYFELLKKELFCQFAWIKVLW